MEFAPNRCALHATQISRPIPVRIASSSAADDSYFDCTASPQLACWGGNGGPQRARSWLAGVEGELRIVLTYLWISFGAVVGASLRYVVGRFVARAVTASFTYGTLLINITGSFVLGLFLVWSTERALPDPRWGLLFASGFCGSYTTFSSFAFG